MNKNNKLCPQFPYWGASYPDACCVDGKLQDLDYCDENGNLYDKGEDVPCPFCRTEEFIEYDPFSWVDHFVRKWKRTAMSLPILWSSALNKSTTGLFGLD